MLNKVMIIGNVGREPEMKYLANGDAVTTFSVAVNRVYNDAAGERKEDVEWFSVTAWRRLAEVCAQYLTKGRLVYVEGRMQTRSWEDQEGQKRYRTELVAQEVRFLGPSPDGGREGGVVTRATDDGGGGGGGDIDPDDLPFAADPAFMGWQGEHVDGVR